MLSKFTLYFLVCLKSVCFFKVSSEVYNLRTYEVWQYSRQKSLGVISESKKKTHTLKYYVYSKTENK